MRNILPTIFMFAAMSLATQAAAEPYHIKRDGLDLQYEVTTLADGKRRITGLDNKTGERFKFLVNGRRVTGSVGGTRVSFRAPKPRTIDASSTQLAAK